MPRSANPGALGATNAPVNSPAMPAYFSAAPSGLAVTSSRLGAARASTPRLMSPPPIGPKRPVSAPLAAPSPISETPRTAPFPASASAPQKVEPDCCGSNWLLAYDRTSASLAPSGAVISKRLPSGAVISYFMERVSSNNLVAVYRFFYGLYPVPAARIPNQSSIPEPYPCLSDP